jgi:hypothetical protein
MTAEYETCPGCGAALPKVDGPTHRYIEASPACWALYTALTGAGEPPMAPAPAVALIVDAYAVQHPGAPSDQAIQSVAVHLLALYGVFERGVVPENALWVRRRALREDVGSRRGRFRWLAPPTLTGSPTVADIVAAPTPAARAEQARRYVEAAWSLWSAEHGGTISAWYDEFIVPD